MSEREYEAGKAHDDTQSGAPPRAREGARHDPSVAHRIALLGGECTGKSTLARALGARLPARVVEERLRSFCSEMGRTPRAHEQRSLLREQIRLEELALESARREGLRWVVCDSTPLATAIYSANYFGDESLMAQALAHQRGYLMTLVPALDLPWVADGIQRDGLQVRESFHRAVLEVLRANALAHAQIAGGGEARTRAALAALAAAGVQAGSVASTGVECEGPRSL